MPFKYILYLFLIASVVSCKKKKSEPDVAAPATLNHGILVLNEGLFQQNNSTLSWINTEDGSVNLDFFEQKTNRGLGDTGNDIARYGNKIYIVVNVSSTVEILDAITGNSLKQISMISNGFSKQPRSLAFNNGKAYVSCFDGFVDVIDTVSLNITNRIQVGSNPEGMAVSNGKLFVANSGGLNAPNVDSTLSVIDLLSEQEVTRIVVGKNPGTVDVDSDGEIYCISRGDYASIPPRLHRINPLTLTKEQTFSYDVTGISKMNDSFIIRYKQNGNQLLGIFNSQTELISQTSIIPLSDFTTLYSFQYSASTNKVYCTDANNYTNTGFVRVYSTSGQFVQAYHVGLNPSKLLIYE